MEKTLSREDALKIHSKSPIECRGFAGLIGIELDSLQYPKVSSNKVAKNVSVLVPSPALMSMRQSVILLDSRSGSINTP